MVNSNQKGKNGEREFANFLKDRGITARRSQQYCGTESSADVLSDLPFHIEVKRTEKLSVYEALEQAKSDCGAQTPIVVHRRSRKPWIVIMDAEDFLGVINARD